MPIDLAGRRQAPGTTRTLASGPDSGVVRRTVLPGGLRVISESVPGVRSVAFGVWVGVGSRDETPSLAGASHYLEHLLFKGTRRRDALAIAAELEAVGGELNAFTAKEYTCYYARVLDNDLPLAVDVICDMVTSSVLASREVDNERTVILEEIAMHDDDPGDAVHDLFADIVWPQAPLGRPVLGTVESITAITRNAIAGYYRRRYRPGNLVVAAAGNLDHNALVRLVRRAFGDVAAAGEAAPAAPRVGGRPPLFVPGSAVVSRPTEQANFVLGATGLPRLDERRFALGVLNAAFGGGMSSRLFQEVREKRGLAYSVYSYTSGFADCGLFGVYAGCRPSQVHDVLKICRDELDHVAEHGLPDEEIGRAVGQLQGSTVLGLEDTGALMNRIGKSELCWGEQMSVDDMLAQIASVTPDAVRSVARDILGQRPSLSVIGPLKDKQAARLHDAVA